MSIKVKVIGTKMARRAIARLRMDMHDVMEDVSQQWTTATRDGAQALVPVDSGDLQEAIEASARGKGASRDAQVGVYDREEYYSQFVEWGTSKMAAQPFMYPAAAAANKQVPGWIKDGINERLP